MVKLLSRLENRLMHLAQRFADGAVFGLIAGAVFGEAMRQDDRAVDGADHFERADAARVAGQLVAAVGAGERLEDAGFGELLEDFGEQRNRQAVGVGNVLGAGRRAGNRGEVPECDEAVIRFLGQLEHWNPDLLCP